MTRPFLRVMPLLLVGCGWFASATPTPATDAGADLAALLPRCRPPNATPARGEVPWKAGQTTASGWTVSAVEADNEEYVRVGFTKGAENTKIEVAYNEAGVGDWSTTRYRLMPAPDQTPPEELLNEAMATLKAADGAGAPFVTKKVGVIDPYAGLPDCGPDGNPT